ncbi:MAG: hypothetical protein LBC18_06210 [Opitutaceae bacterium]|jgi:hypothetical protein|nr:hypothetical protein [Opitutaceae bacterium]
MITRALDKNHDWTFGKGRQNYLRGERALTQSILTRLLSFTGDCFFDLSAGVDWWNLTGGKDRLSLLLQTRRVIAGADGVMAVNDLDAILDPKTRLLSLRYSVDTVYTLSQTGTISEVLAHA